MKDFLSHFQANFFIPLYMLMQVYSYPDNDIQSFHTNFEEKLVFFEDANTFTCLVKYILVASTFLLSVFS